MSFQEQVQRDAAIDATAFEFKTLAEAMKGTHGIVFIYARWSGTAIHAWQTLTTALATLERLPAVVVVDADEFQPALANELLGELPQGKGETFWMKQGRIVAMLSGYRESATETIFQHSQSLIL